MSRIRQREIHARRVRKMKLRSLRARYSDAKSATQKEQIVIKVARVAPWLSLEQFAGKKK